MKKIVVSNHAKMRIKKYGFEEVFIIETIKQPDEVVTVMVGGKQLKRTSTIIYYERYMKSMKMNWWSSPFIQRKRKDIGGKNEK